MTKLNFMRGAVCTAALLSATGAFADVTAQQVWDDWKSNLDVYGQDGISIGSEALSGDTLTVNDLVLSMSEDGTDVTATMGNLIFTEQGDGTVEITMSDNFPIVVSSDFGDSVEMSVNHSGMVMIVSGNVQEMNYAFEADNYTLQVDKITDGSDVIEGDMRIAINGLSGTFTTSTGNLRHMDYTYAADSVDVIVDIKEPGGDGYVLIGGQIQNIAAAANIALPIDANMEEPEDLFKNGFSVNGGYGFDSANYIFDISVDGDAMSGSVGMNAGTLEVEMSSAIMAYAADVTDVAVSISSADLPFPVNVTLAEYGVGFSMPLAASDTASEFGMRINLTDLIVNEELWAMVPGGDAFPHTPATAQLDLTGMVKVLFDVLDPEQADAMAMAEMPAELQSVTLNNLKLAVAGAVVTASGGSTFDFSDMETFDGFPRPTGEINVDITGANTLIDTLVEIGLLPEEEAMMGRMMMGMFAQTVGDDHLTSKLEINDQGHVIANGQRIQ